MGIPGDSKEQLNETVEHLKARLEFEAYFSTDYLPVISKAVDIKPDLAINQLYQKVRECVFCQLHKTRTNVVFGDGNLNAKLVFVGEAPGRDEDLQAKPFVGLAGGLLTKIINAMHLERSDVYITNVLRCRPPHNRDPLPEEVVCCKPYLMELLEIIKPKVICTLGKFAAHTLLNETNPISRLRGKWFDFNGVKLIATYHPAYLLRNPADKKLVWQDMQKIMEVLKQDET